MNLWRSKFALLVRREFWEHRSLLIAPLAAAGLMLVAVIFGRGRQTSGFQFNVSPDVVDRTIQRDGLAMAAEMTLIGTAVFLGVVACIAVLFYFLDSLYAERKDRSILFWKSMPVSDAETVLAKLATGLVAVPLATLLLALVLQPVMLLITYIRFEPLRTLTDVGLLAGWPPALGRMGAAWIFSVLWYLPVVSYLLLASVLSRRAPIAMAILPLVLVSLFESWLLDQNTVSRFIGQRLMPWDFAAPPLLSPRGAWWAPFQDLRLWYGLAAGIVMVYIVIRLRRYRDDT